MFSFGFNQYSVRFIHSVSFAAEVTVVTTLILFTVLKDQNITNKKNAINLTIKINLKFNKTNTKSLSESVFTKYQS